MTTVMIDAYEIGIQLALQDDVSAGLRVITQGLADVDQAIDATSARLGRLFHSAEVATGAAAAGLTMRPAEADREQQRAPGPQPNMVGTAQRSSSIGAAVPPANAPTSRQTEAKLAETERQVRPHIAHERIVAAAAPSLSKESGSNDVAVPDAPSAPSLLRVEHSIEPAPLVSPVRTSALIAQESATQAGRARGGSERAAPSVVRSVAPDMPKEAGTKQSERVVTAAVAQAGAPSRSQWHEDVSAPVRAQREPAAGVHVRSAAPWAGLETRVLSPRPREASERAVAPQGRAQEGAEGMTGNVMLDGQLVGHWLAEILAKEASRPPNGTSFFDPRQTPAWTASGSL